MNISKIRTSDHPIQEISYFNTNGFMTGLNAKYPFNDRFNLQLEGAYSQKGYESQAKIDPNRYKIHLNYIDFALLCEYSINDIIALNAAANYGIKVSEKINGSKEILSDYYKGIDTGLVGGLKFYIGQLFIRTTYQYGLGAIDKLYTTDENGENIKEFKEFNQVFQVSVGYYLL